MISEELKVSYTPLQCLNNIRDNYFLNKGGTDLEYTWFNVIETALNDYDTQRQRAIVYRKVIENNEKKLQALEFIKENMYDFEDYIFEYKGHYYIFNYDHEISKQAYDLLKEALL